MSKMFENFSNIMNNPEMSNKMRTFLDALNNTSNNANNINISNSSTNNYNKTTSDTNHSKKKDNTRDEIDDNSNSNTSNEKNYNTSTQTYSNDNINNNYRNTEATDSTAETATTSNNIFGNIDFNTIFKIQQIMNSLNDTKSDSRSNLLLSLKPYLKESRKNKIDQYIQLMKIGKIFETMNLFGGDNKYV